MAPRHGLASCSGSARFMLEMDATIAQAPPAAAGNTNTVRWLLILAVFGLLWFELIAQLKPEWWLNPQYNYGVIVPVLLVYLLWKRWLNRPAQATPHARPLAILTMVFAAALFLPVRLVAEANPDWRLLSWVLAFVVITISLAIVYLSGGYSWLKHFAFPFRVFSRCRSVASANRATCHTKSDANRDRD